MQTQKQTRWCWAAVAVSVDDYLSADGSSWTQCELATDVLGNTVNCCTHPQACNKAQYLEDALSAVGRFDRWVSGSLSFEDILKQLNKPLQFPVCVRMGWYGGGGHFVVIAGCYKSTSGKKFVEVADPWYLDSTLTYDDFCYRYQHKGKWTDTYYVHS